MNMPAKTRVAIAGLGAIGKVLARELAQGRIEGLQLVAVSARDQARAADFAAALPGGVQVVPIDQLEPLADLVIECAPAALLPDIVTPFLQAGKTAVVLSVGGLLRRPDLIEQARASGGTLQVPSGALLGLDAILACAEGAIHEVQMSSRKPPQGFAGAPYLVRQGISLEGLREPLKIFSGNALEAVEGFPANVNVVAALSLAGVGALRTRVELWADPGITRNMHAITVDAEAARFTVSIENIPSDNPRTSRIVVMSVLALLRKRTAALRIGT